MWVLALVYASVSHAGTGVRVGEQRPHGIACPMVMGHAWDFRGLLD